MSLTQPVARLSEIAADYDVVFCDVWGVIHNGRESWPEACAALARFAEAHGPVILVSNSPRPSSDVVAQLDHLKVPRESWQGFVTSGDATLDELARRAPGRAWALGPERDRTLYEGMALTLVDGPEQADFISCTGLYDDAHDTPETYRESLGIAAARDLPMVCANPDRIVQRGDTIIYCAGALADLYESLGGTVIMAGKPHEPIYRLSFERAQALLGRPVAPERVLAIGDGLVTDVMGAEAQGIDCLFVAKGIHGEAAMSANGGLDVAGAQSLLVEAGTRARYSTLDLVW